METLVKLVAGFAIFAASLFADYTTYIGDQYVYQTTALTADATGNTYITGSRILAASIAGNYGSRGPLSDVFVIKLDPGRQDPVHTDVRRNGNRSGAGNRARSIR
jgi:hypothetical protein